MLAKSSQMNKVIYLTTALFLFFHSMVNASEDKEWAYEGEHGPEHWGQLSTEYDFCSRGSNQSPIDLIADIDGDLPELVFEYSNRGHLVEVNTGHAIQEQVNAGSYIRIRDGNFESKQFHFHSPSEHTVGGKFYPMEVHLVHQDEKGNLVVVGILFEEGERNAAMDQLPSFKAARGEDSDADSVDYKLLFPNGKDYFYYSGSLTTPPCSEGVYWMIFKQPVIASPEQIQHYHNLLGFNNNRPIQPKNSRLVIE
jgi:carbonic anhydrase